MGVCGEFAGIPCCELRCGVPAVHGKSGRSRAGTLHLGSNIAYLINEALMVPFLFVVGLEIKYEIVSGELRDPRRGPDPRNLLHRRSVNMVAPSGGCRRRPGLAAVAGIGLTVSLFIADLSFDAGSTLQSEAKMGILVGSLAAALIGTIELVVSSQRRVRHRGERVPAAQRSTGNRGAAAS
jgi:hypothetical protein